MKKYKITYSFYGCDVSFETTNLLVLSQKLDEVIDNPHIEPGSVNIMTEEI